MTEYFNGQPIDNSNENAADEHSVEDQGIVGKKTKTKEEQIADFDSRIAKLVKRREDFINGVVHIPVVNKVVPLPEVGAVINFRYGRTTDKTSPVIKTGTVIAVRAAVTDELKKLPAQVRVSVGEGFDIELLTIYPAQIVEEDSAE